MGTLEAFSLFGGLFSEDHQRNGPLLAGCTGSAPELPRPPATRSGHHRNQQLDLLTERFQTRFQSIKLAAPTTEDIATMLRRHWPVDEATSLRIAVGSGGCVRAALADLESWLDASDC